MEREEGGRAALRYLTAWKMEALCLESMRQEVESLECDTGC